MTEPVEVHEPQPGSSLSNLVNTFVAPREAFESLARRATFALALVTCVLAPLALSVVLTPRLDMETIVRQKIAEQDASLSEAEIDRRVEMADKLKWIGTGMQVVLQPAFYLVLGAIFLAAFRLLGSEIDYRQCLAVVTHGMLPIILAALISIAVILFRGGEITVEQAQAGSFLSSNLGVLAGEGTSRVTRALLSSVDLFSAWTVVLLAMGFRIVGRVKAGTAWAGVLAIWGVGIVIKVGLAAISSNF